MMYQVVSKQTQNCNKILIKTLLQMFILAITKSVYHREKKFNKTKKSYISKVKFSIRFNRFYDFFQTVHNYNMVVVNLC